MRISASSCRAFTLVEVILAIAIITGLLAVALFFYQQAANLRSEISQEVDRISAARLLMDRITTELRCARRHSFFEVPLTGTADSMQFITTSLPTHAAWGGESYGRITRPEVDMKYVTYSAAADESGTNVTGLSRREEPLVSFRSPPSAAMPAGESSTNRFAAVLLTERLRSMRFRYWSGTAWQESWSETKLPAAVEITLSADPSSDLAASGVAVGAEPDPDRIFRRVVYVPGSAMPAPRSGGSTNAVSGFGMEDGIQ